MNPKARLLLIGLLFLFILVRLPGLSVPYHQDEFKTAIVTEAGLSEASAFLTHPPLTALLFRTDALVFGGENMRIMPLLFGFLSAVLLFAVVRRRFSERAALWSVFLYAISFYGIWSSLMLDTDGAILPALFLAALYCYDCWRTPDGQTKRWLALLLCALIIGLLVKLSFVLVVGVLAIDFLFEKRRELTSKRLLHFGALGAGVLILVVAAFILVKLLNPAFNIGGMVSHALYYVRWSGRSYLQIAIQSLKAAFYLSPLLLVLLPFISKDIVKKTTPFLWYLGLGFVFYFVLFDFSHGALDKYLMFTIIPLSAIGGMILSERLHLDSIRRAHIIIGALAAIAFILTLFIVPEVVPLYPKTLWFSRVLHGDWNVLTPFNGGSGPVGFYVSFLTIACGFLIAGFAAIVGRFKKALSPIAFVVILAVGIAYNAAFIEEFSMGTFYGSTETALASALVYLAAADDIKRVNTHNDIGAYELKHMGKYDSHFTAAPQFERLARDIFPTYKGVFLVVDMPRLYDGFYRDFFNSCTILFTARSGVITSTVYSACTWTKE